MLLWMSVWFLNLNAKSWQTFCTDIALCDEFKEVLDILSDAIGSEEEDIQMEHRQKVYSYLMKWQNNKLLAQLSQN